MVNECKIDQLIELLFFGTHGLSTLPDSRVSITSWRNAMNYTQLELKVVVTKLSDAMFQQKVLQTLWRSFNAFMSCVPSSSRSKVYHMFSRCLTLPKPRNTLWNVHAGLFLDVLEDLGSDPIDTAPDSVKEEIRKGFYHMSTLMHTTLTKEDKVHFRKSLLRAAASVYHPRDSHGRKLSITSFNDYTAMEELLMQSEGRDFVPVPEALRGVNPTEPKVIRDLAPNQAIACIVHVTGHFMFGVGTLKKMTFYDTLSKPRCVNEWINMKTPENSYLFTVVRAWEIEGAADDIIEEMDELFANPERILIQEGETHYACWAFSAALAIYAHHFRKHVAFPKGVSVGEGAGAGSGEGSGEGSGTSEHSEMTSVGDSDGDVGTTSDVHTAVGHADVFPEHHDAGHSHLSERFLTNFETISVRWKRHRQLKHRDLMAESRRIVDQINKYYGDFPQDVSDSNFDE